MQSKVFLNQGVVNQKRLVVGDEGTVVEDSDRSGEVLLYLTQFIATSITSNVMVNSSYFTEEKAPQGKHCIRTAKMMS